MGGDYFAEHAAAAGAQAIRTTLRNDVTGAEALLQFGNQRIAAQARVMGIAVIIAIDEMQLHAGCDRVAQGWIGRRLGFTADYADRIKALRRTLQRQRVNMIGENTAETK
jgi:hypothetical protein